MATHPLLERQIHKHLAPEDAARLGGFLVAVDRAYRHADEARQRVERSMDLMSEELNTRLEEKLRSQASLQAEHLAQAALIKRLEEAHNQLLQSEKMASIGQLAAGVAHEINNPIGYVNSNLGTLRGYVDSLLGVIDVYEAAEPLLPDGEEKARIVAAKRQADLGYLKTDLVDLCAETMDGIGRVRRIVQDLKEFSHTDKGEWVLADLHKGLESTLNVVNNELKYKARVVREYGELPALRCLPAQLNQVFMNLLVNAAHAIEEQAACRTLVVDSENQPRRGQFLPDSLPHSPAMGQEAGEKWTGAVDLQPTIPKSDRLLGTITIRTGLKGEEAWVEIADTGKGMPAHLLTRIFDPFFTTKPVGVGTGLGLSISYGIVNKHGGRIEVASEPGQGTTFRVVLPLQPTPSTDHE